MQYATIPKTVQVKPIEHTKYQYLDRVHINIVFGDISAMGGAHCVLVFIIGLHSIIGCFPLNRCPHLKSATLLISFALKLGGTPRFLLRMR